MTRAAAARRVFFVEEPIPTDGPEDLQEYTSEEGVRVCVPRVRNPDLAAEETVATVRRLVSDLIAREEIRSPVLWHYSAMWEPVSADWEASAVVFDCMDELAAFRFAPVELRERERALMARADRVFAGGRSLYEARRNRHASVHLFPSSIDFGHFATARSGLPEPGDLRGVARPRLGFAGVIDERMDLGLIRSAVLLRPDWQWILVGPVVKLDPEMLPHGPNLHMLGAKSYAELPGYMAHWDVGILPFALNESTRFISPTKTPEYLAAGLPVVSTPIHDVVQTYGEAGVVEIADGAEAFVEACEKLLAVRGAARQGRADQMLAATSWDRTWAEMDRLIRNVPLGRRANLQLESLAG